MADNATLMLRGPLYGNQGTPVPETAGYSGGQRMVDAHGRYLDAALGRRLFFASKQAAGAWSVALNATHTGFVLSNPAGSNVLLVPLFAGFALTVAPAGIASMGFFVGWSSGGITTHTTPLTPLSTYIASDQPSGAVKADEAATLVGTPRWCHHFLGGFTAAALPSAPLPAIPIEGGWVIPPNGYFGIGALTAVTGFASMVWEEIPIIT